MSDCGGCDELCRDLSLLDGPKGDAGADGQDGTFGANSDLFQFNALTVGNPGNGFVLFDNASVAAATSISVSNVDAAAVTVTTWLAALNTSNATLKGFIRVNKEFDSTAFVMYSVSAYTANAGYGTFTISYLTGSSASPFAANDRIIFSYVISGNNGAAGVSATTILYNNCTIVDSGITTGVDVIQKTFNIPANTFLTNGSVATIEATNYCDDDRFSSFAVSDYDTIQLLNNAVVTSVNGGIYANRFHAREWRITINRTGATTALVVYHVLDNQQPNQTYFSAMTGLDFTQVFNVSIYANTSAAGVSGAGYIKSVRLYIDFKAF